jgi:hypothetical protein
MWDAPTIIATAIGGAGLGLALIALGLQLKDKRGAKGAGQDSPSRG